MEQQMMLLMQGMQELLKERSSKQEAPQGFKPKFSEPDTYLGDRAPGAVTSWVRTVERYLRMTTLDRDTQWVPYAVLKLRGEAEEWWEHHSLNHPEILEWHEFCSHITAEFHPLCADQTARDRIAELQQTGSVEEYVAQFRRLRMQIPLMQDDEARDRFIRGLSQTIRSQVRTRFPQSSEEAQRMALAYQDAFADSHQGTTQPQQGVSVYPRSNGVAPMDLDVIRSRPMQQGWRSRGQTRSWSPRTSEVDLPEKQCYNCGGMGHIARRCSSGPRMQARMKQASGQGKGQARWD